MESHSWFDMNQAPRNEAEQPNPPSSFNETLANAIIPSDPDPHLDSNLSLRVVRFALLPTPDQKKKLAVWMGAARWTYNATLAAVNEARLKEEKVVLDVIRKQVVNKKKLEVKEETKWLLGVPNAVRDAAYQDFKKTYHTCMKRYKSGELPHFRLHFRSKKRAARESINIDKREMQKCKGDELAIFPRFNLGKIKCEEKLPVIEHACRLVRTRLGKYYISIPVPLAVVGESQAPAIAEEQKVTNEAGVLSLDPGVRTFMTGYDPSGNVFKWATNAHKAIMTRKFVQDKLRKKIAQKVGHEHKRLRYTFAFRLSFSKVIYTHLSSVVSLLGTGCAGNFFISVNASDAWWLICTTRLPVTCVRTTKSSCYQSLKLLRWSPGTKPVAPVNTRKLSKYRDDAKSGRRLSGS